MKGSPRRLEQHRVQLSLTVAQMEERFFCLDILYMVRSKMRHCVTRDMARDVQDVIYLLDNYVAEIKTVRNQLNKNEVDEFLELPWTKEVPAEVIAGYRDILGR
jgi:hypothetical protein